MVAHRTLTPFVRVRILHPLPRKTGQFLRKWPVFPYFGSFLRGLSLFWPVFGARMDEYFLLKNVDPLFDPKTFFGSPFRRPPRPDKSKDFSGFGGLCGTDGQKFFQDRQLRVKEARSDFSVKAFGQHSFFDCEADFFIVVLRSRICGGRAQPEPLISLMTFTATPWIAKSSIGT